MKQEKYTSNMKMTRMAKVMGYLTRKSKEKAKRPTISTDEKSKVKSAPKEVFPSSPFYTDELQKPSWVLPVLFPFRPHSLQAI